MTCLIPIGLSGTGIKLDASKVGDVFGIHLGTKYADFQEKISAEISGKLFQTFGTYIKWSFSQKS